MSGRLLTRAEVAAMKGVSENAIAVAAREKRLGHVKVGNSYRFREDDVDAWLESLRVAPKPRDVGDVAPFRLTPRAEARLARAVSR